MNSNLEHKPFYTSFLPSFIHSAFVFRCLSPKCIRSFSTAKTSVHHISAHRKLAMNMLNKQTNVWLQFLKSQKKKENGKEALNVFLYFNKDEFQNQQQHTLTSWFEKKSFKYITALIYIDICFQYICKSP